MMRFADVHLRDTDTGYNRKDGDKVWVLVVPANIPGCRFAFVGRYSYPSVDLDDDTVCFLSYREAKEMALPNEVPLNLSDFFRDPAPPRFKASSIPLGWPVV